jgi:cytochrome c553
MSRRLETALTRPAGVSVAFSYRSTVIDQMAVASTTLLAITEDTTTTEVDMTAATATEAMVATAAGAAITTTSTLAAQLKRCQTCHHISPRRRPSMAYTHHNREVDLLMATHPCRRKATLPRTTDKAVVRPRMAMVDVAATVNEEATIKVMEGAIATAVAVVVVAMGKARTGTATRVDEEVVVAVVATNCVLLVRIFGSGAFLSGRLSREFVVQVVGTPLLNLNLDVHCHVLHNPPMQILPVLSHKRHILFDRLGGLTKSGVGGVGLHCEDATVVMICFHHELGGSGLDVEGMLDFDR